MRERRYCRSTRWIGVPPMVSLASRYHERATAITGFRGQSAVILSDAFDSFHTPQILCTDDGSAGIHGLVTVPLEEELQKEVPDMVYACGPTPMLRAIAAVAAKYHAPCEVSLEQHMGCGLGACLVCQCRLRTADGEEVKRVCKDGPVFKLLQRTMSAAFGREIPIARICGATDSRHWQALGVPVPVLGVSGANEHAADEFVELDSIGQTADAIVEFASALAQ